MALNERKRRYAESRLNGKSQSESARDAGCSPKTAPVTGCRWENDPDVRAYIEAEQNRLKKKTGMTRERWLKGLTRIAEADMSHFARWGEGAMVIVPTKELPKGASRLIREVQETPSDHGPRIKVKLKDSVKAYELIGRALGYFDKEDSGRDVESIRITVEDYTADE